MDSNQDVESWLAEIARRPSVFNHNLRLHAGEFRGFDLANEVTMAGSNGATEHVYLFAKRGAAEETLMRVSVCDHDDTRHALAGLRETLDHSMRPDHPRAADKLGKLADIGFALPAERNEGLGAAWFSVGNVAVTMHSAGATPIDVSAAAAHLGTMLAGTPKQAALRSKRATAFSPTPVELRAGEALPLIEQLPEGRPGADRIQVIAPDGEFRREGAALVYVARSSGPQRIALFTHTQGGRV